MARAARLACLLQESDNDDADDAIVIDASDGEAEETAAQTAESQAAAAAEVGVMVAEAETGARRRCR